MSNVSLTNMQHKMQQNNYQEKKSRISSPSWLKRCNQNAELSSGLENRKWLNSNAFNRTLINTSSNAEVAFLAPLSTPAVLDCPEFLSSFFVRTVANQQYGMIGQLERTKAVVQAWNLNIINR